MYKNKNHYLSQSSLQCDLFCIPFPFALPITGLKIRIEYQPNNIVLQLRYQLLKNFACQNQLHVFVSFLYNFHLKVTCLGPC